MRKNRWIEYVAAGIFCAGLWMGSLVEEITLYHRILQMVMMLAGLGILVCWELRNKAEPKDEEEQRQKEYLEKKCRPVLFYSLLGIYGVIGVYGAAFEKSWFMTVVILIFAHLIVYGVLRKKYLKDYRSHHLAKGQNTTVHNEAAKGQKKTSISEIAHRHTGGL